MSEATNPTAIPLITNDDNGRFQVHEEAVEILNAIEAPLAIIAVAGMWRTGKSFLLNSLLGLNGKPDSFVVGNTVHACTKGLWLWGAPIKLPDGLNVLFVDSEGLGSTSRTQTEDCQIFSLAILLSSFFIWNSRGVIDGNALEDFGLVVNLTKYIHSRNPGADGGAGGGGSELDTLAEHFPSFLWVVRDFSLRLETNGRSIDDRQYLENALKPQQGLGKDAQSRNQIRELLATFFKTRDCVTLVRPAEDEAMLRNLTAQPLENLRQEFVTGLTLLKKKVFGTVRPKTLNGRLMTGAMLATLTQSYCDALNSGGVPTISTAWDRVLENQAAESVGKAVEAYTKSMSKALAVKVPQLQQALTQARNLRRSRQSAFRGSGAPRAGSADGVTGEEKEEEGGEDGTQGWGLGGCKLPLEDTALLDLDDKCRNEAMKVFQESLWGRGGEGSSNTMSPATHAKLRTAMASQLKSVETLNWCLSHEACSALAKSLASDLLLTDQAIMGGMAEKKKGGGFFGFFGAGGQKGEKGEEASQSGANLRSSQELQGWYDSFCRACANLRERYMQSAVGPAKDQVYSELMTQTVAPIPATWINTITTLEKRNLGVRRNDLAKLQEKQEGLSGKLAAERTALSQEQSSMERATKDALQSTSAAVEIAKAQKTAKEGEIQRMEVEVKRLQDAFDFAVQEMSAKIKDQDDVLVAMQDSCDQIQRQVSALEGEDGQDDHVDPSIVENLGGQMNGRQLKEALSARILIDQREVDLMHEHASLIGKNIQATKDLLKAKDCELQECEFQWGVTKGNLAEAEGEYHLVEEETRVLASLLVKLKTHIQGRSRQLPSDLTRLLSQQQLNTLGSI